MATILLYSLENKQRDAFTPAGGPSAQQAICQSLSLSNVLSEWSGHRNQLSSIPALLSQ